MLPLLAPILAQLVTLNLGDRTTARYVHSDVNHTEASTQPLVGLNFDWRRSALMLAYMPTITVIPLEKTPRDVLVFHYGSLLGNYRWRNTIVTLTESIGYG